MASRSTALFEDLDTVDIKGRITVMTVAESFDRPELEKRLKQKFPALQVRLGNGGRGLVIDNNNQ
jgi:hypothetical protein